jgi:hypothetical protein
LERAVGVAYLRRGRQVALIMTVFRQLVVTSSVNTAIVIPTTTSVVATVVVVAT